MILSRVLTPIRIHPSSSMYTRSCFLWMPYQVTYHGRYEHAYRPIHACITADTHARDGRCDMTCTAFMDDLHG